MHYDPKCEFSRQSLALSLIAQLEEKGFTQTSQSPSPEWSELVYHFPIKGTPLFVRIFTSVVKDSSYGLIARTTGKDAIRINVVSPDVKRALVTETRINRAGNIDSIIDRTLDRARDAYRLGQQAGVCKKCGAPRAQSKAKKWYCSSVCWKTEEEKSTDQAKWRANNPRRRRRRRY